MATNVENLGVGIGLRVPHMRDIFTELPKVDVFEIISENFMVDGGPPLRNLDRLLEHYRVVMHGVSMGLGSAEPLDWDYLRRLKRLADHTNTPWLSDHLCWTKSGNAHHHDLLPLPYTEETINYVAERARIVQDFLERPFAIENLSSYVAFSDSDMSEWEFYRAVCERADCSLMLDVNNIYVSSVNHQFDPWEYLDHMPFERVVQMHVAGHTEREDGHLLDTHDHHVKDTVWDLYHAAWHYCGGVTTILEWDENFLNLSDTLAEANKARHFMTRRRHEQAPNAMNESAS